MQVLSYSTRPLHPPKDDLFSLVRPYYADIPARSVCVISSKVVAINEGRCVRIPQNKKEKNILRDTLAREECEWYLEREKEGGSLHTITRGILIGRAGIDESNGDGFFTLFPRDPDASARALLDDIVHHTGRVDIGVIVSDSRSDFLRNGSRVCTLGYAGFLPLHDYRGEQDIFGKKMRASRFNIADSIAAAAGCVMGEAKECTPLVIVSDIPHIVFTRDDHPEHPYLSLAVSKEDDKYAPFYRHLRWKQGGTYEN